MDADEFFEYVGVSVGICDIFFCRESLWSEEVGCGVGFGEDVVFFKL